MRCGWQWGLVIVLVGAFAVSWGHPSAANASGSGQQCSTAGMRPIIRSITAHNTPCASARRLVNEWRHRLLAGQCIWQDGSTQPGVCTIAIWRCSAYHTIDGQTYPVVCEARAGRRKVRFIHLV